jgi:hypothetical protein
MDIMHDDNFYAEVGLESQTSRGSLRYLSPNQSSDFSHDPNVYLKCGNLTLCSQVNYSIVHVIS